MEAEDDDLCLGANHRRVRSRRTTLHLGVGKLRLVGLIVQNAEPLASVLLWRRKARVGHHEAGISCLNWPIGQLRLKGAGRSLPWRLNSEILRRPEVLGFTTSTWTSRCSRPDAKLAAEPAQLGRLRRPATCESGGSGVGRQASLCYIIGLHGRTDLVYASATCTLQ